MILVFYQAYGFDDDEEYDVDDGGDDGMIFSWDCISSLKNCNIRVLLKVSRICCSGREFGPTFDHFK